MSHRIKIHDAEKYMDKLDQKWNLTNNLKKIFSQKEELGEAWPEDCYFPIFAGGFFLIEALHSLGYPPSDLTSLIHEGKIPYPETIACFAEWQRSKHIFKFDKSLGEEIVNMDLSEEMPLEVIKRIPYTCFFAEYPVSRATLSLKNYTTEGFYVFKTLSSFSVDGVVSENVEQLVILYLENDVVIPLQISLTQPTLKQVIDEFYYTDVTDENKVSGIEEINGIKKEITIKDLCGNLNISYDQYKELYYDKMREQLKQIFNIIFYICSEGSDVITVYTPQKKKETSTKHLLSKASLYKVGSRIGPALGQARIAYEKQISDSSGGAKKAPHIRRGHFHRYLTGPKDGTQKTIIKWLPPQGINLDLGKLIPTIHDVKK